MEQKVVQKDPEQSKKSKPNMTGIPTQMKLDFERRSGLSFDDVRVHYNSDKPAKIDALAYTQGGQVFIGPGHHQHLQHELIHVIQQKTGRVKSGFHFDNIIINDSQYLEAEASHNVINRGTISHNLTTNIIQRTKFPPPPQKAQTTSPITVGAQNTQAGKNAAFRRKKVHQLFLFDRKKRSAKVIKIRPNFSTSLRRRYPSKINSTSIDHIVSFNQIRILVEACINQYLSPAPVTENLFLRIVNLVLPKVDNPLTQLMYNRGVSTNQQIQGFWKEVKESRDAVVAYAIDIHLCLTSAHPTISTTWLTLSDINSLTVNLFYLVDILNQSLVNLRLGGAQINSAISDSLDPIYQAEIMCKLNGKTCVIYANKSVESQFMSQRLHRLLEFVKKLPDFSAILGPRVGISVVSSDLKKPPPMPPHTPPIIPHKRLSDFGHLVDYYLIAIHQKKKTKSIVMHIAFFTSKGVLAMYQSVKGSLDVATGSTLRLVLQGQIDTKIKPLPSSAAKELTLTDINALINELITNKSYILKSGINQTFQDVINYPLSQ